MEVLLAIAVIALIIFIAVKRKNSIWKKKHYVDDFGHATKNSFIIQKEKAFGTFSNSATSHSSMSFYAYIGKDDTSFRFWDYDKYELKNTGSDKLWADFKCLSSSGQRLDGQVYLEGYSSDMYIDGYDDTMAFINMLKENKYVEVVISSGNLEYRFKLKRGNFKSLHDSLK